MWHISVQGGEGQANPNYCEFVLDSASDINTEPNWKTFIGYKPSIGSVAYVCESGGTALSNMYMRASDETWVSF